MRRQQEMEREKANEEKLRKQQIAKERFLGFFKKVDTTPLKVNGHPLKYKVAPSKLNSSIPFKNK